MADPDKPERSQAEVANTWLTQIKMAEKAAKPWHDRCKRIIKRYRDERSGDDTMVGGRGDKRLNVLWSNVQTLQPAVYAHTPKPVVTRRYNDQDPVGRVASQILERGLSYSLEEYDFDETMTGARDDYLLCARGQAWVRYTPTFGPEETPRIALSPNPSDEVGATDTLPVGLALDTPPGYTDPDGAEVPPELVRMADDGTAYRDGDPFSPKVAEEVSCDYIAWPDFLHSAAPRWDKVTWVAKRERMTREQLIERFGEEIGRAVPLNDKPERISDEELQATGETLKRAAVWEIWDKTKRCALWICQDYKEGPLDKQDDPLGLRGFFPCPRPLYATITTDSLTPVPDYVLYQDQAEEIDELTIRINLLVEAVKVAGVYDGSLDSTGRSPVSALFNGRAINQLIPVDNWAVWSEKGGFKGAISFVPFGEVVAAIQQLYVVRAQTKAEMDEITGISDIVRGQGNANATATAERIKGQYATLRLSERQKAVARFARDLIRLKAEVMAEHFDPQTLLEMSGYAQTPAADPQLFEAAIALLKNDRLRGFRIDIETDSTIEPDRQMEQEARVQYLGAMAQFLPVAVEAAAAMPELAPLMGETIKFASRTFAAGRDMEGVLEQAIQALEGKAQQPKPPDPAQAKAQAEMQGAQARLQMDQQAAAAKAQLDGAVAQQKAVAEQAEQQQRFQLDAQRAQFDMALAERRMDAEVQLQREKMAAELQLQREKAAAQIELERIKAGIQLARVSKAPPAGRPSDGKGTPA